MRTNPRFSTTGSCNPGGRRTPSDAAAVRRERGSIQTEIAHGEREVTLAWSQHDCAAACEPPRSPEGAGGGTNRKGGDRLPVGLEKPKGKPPQPDKSPTGRPFT